MTSRKRTHPSSTVNFGATAMECRRDTAEPRGETAVGSVLTLQELAGNVIRKQVREERKEIIRKHSDNFDSKKLELDLKREELQRQLQEVEEEMKSMEIACHQEMLTELDHFDSERQPEMLDVLTDTGQLDRICPLCEKFFRSSKDLPECCLGRDKCHLHTVQRCCFSCSRLSFHDIFQCLAVTQDKGKMNSHNEDEEMGGVEDMGIIDDPATLEAANSTPSWMLEQIFGEGAVLNGWKEEEEYEDSAESITAEAIRLVPSETGSVTCPVCHHIYCDHDFLYHFAACCKQAQSDDQESIICLECNE